MCFTECLVALDPMHAKASLDSLNFVHMAGFLAALDPMHIIAFISQSVRSMHESLQYDDGVCMTAAVLAVTVVGVS